MHLSGIDHVPGRRASRSLGLKFGPSVFGNTLGMPLLPFGGRKCGHVICGFYLHYYLSGYLIAPILIWDPQTQNDGWVGAWSVWLKMDNMGIIRSVYLRRLWIWESHIGIVPG
jgi:hypothetical protein